VESGYLVSGLCLDGQTVGSLEECLAIFREGTSPLWIHLQVEDLEPASQLLENEFGFHPLEVEDALSNNERPSLRVGTEDLFLVAPAIVLGQSTERYVEVAFFVQQQSLVSVATSPVPFLDHLLNRCASHPKANPNVITLLHTILDEIVDGYFPAVDIFDDEIDALEEAIYRGQKVAVSDALSLKRRLLQMRRQLVPIRDIINGLLRRDVEFVDASAQLYFQDIYDHILRILEDVDMERDVLSSVLDAQISMTSNNLNEVMRALTVISTVLMTGAFVAGVYGMNFVHMPELKWIAGYPFAIGLMIALGALEVWYFKRKGWI
jgi:magnesium transporter